MNRYFGTGRLLVEHLEPRQLLTLDVTNVLVVAPEVEIVDLVPRSADWAYIDDGSEQDDVWTSAQFDDSAWPTGSAPLGYGEDDEATVIGCGANAPPCVSDVFATYYFRHSFHVPHRSQIASLLGMLTRSDFGTVIYVNGEPIYRDEFLAEDATFEDFGVAARIPTFNTYLAIPASVLQTGTNTIAVEVHRSPDASRGLTFDFELRGALRADEPWEAEVAFSEPVDGDSLQAEDVRINGNPADGVQLVDNSTAVFAIPFETIPFGTIPFVPIPDALDIQLDSGSILADTPERTPVTSYSDSVPLNLPVRYSVKHQPRLQPGNMPLAPYPGSETDQIELVWQTLPIGDGEVDQFTVEYRHVDDSDRWHSVDLNETLPTGVDGRDVWSATIRELEYNSLYEYRVRFLRGPLVLRTYQDQFRTRLPVGSEQPFSFAAYGDSAWGTNITGFRDIHRQLNDSDVAFTLQLGDTAYNVGSHADFDARFDGRLVPEVETWTSSHVDYFSIGNHEMLTNRGQPSRDNFSVPVFQAGVNAPFAPPTSEVAEHNYSFDYGNVHFVTFDTNSLNSPERLDNLLAWVEQDLAASSARWKIVFGHHPVAFSPDKVERPSGNYYQQVVRALNDAGADLFVAGHSHTVHRSKPLLGQQDGIATFVNDNDDQYEQGAGVIQVVSGVGGRSLRLGGFSDPAIARGFSQSTETRSQYGFSKFDVTRDKLTISFVSAWNGEVLDSFEIVAREGVIARVTSESTDSLLDAVDQAFVEFSEPVSNFDLRDLLLTSNASIVPFPESVQLRSSSETQFLITGLSTVTAQGGIYSLTISPTATIVSKTGSHLTSPIPATWVNARHAGDADIDGRFDQADIVTILSANKYGTGLTASWSEGDWNGDGLFDALDIVAALQTGNYLQGPYVAV